MTSDLRRWDCVNVDRDGAVLGDAVYTESVLSVTSSANQLVSCVGAVE